jgi:hypothetical protein
MRLWRQFDVAAIATHENDGYRGVCFTNSYYRLRPVHDRHYDIGDDKIDFAAIGPEE